jgi:mannose-1-phosphate guanylyltransferase
MQALILAGGEGTRLRPLTSTMPKPVVPLVGRPFIAYMLEWLAGHGVDDVILACGFMADDVRSVLGDGGDFGVRLSYVEEPEPLGTGGALKFAEGLLEERFFMLNGDVLADLDLTAQLAQHEATGARGTLALIAVEDPSAYGLVGLQDDGSVRDFIEKPEFIEQGQQVDTNLVNAGAYILERDVLDEMGPAGTNISIERDVFPKLVGRGLFGFLADGYWLDIGTPERYLQATFDILEGRIRTDLEVRPHGAGTTVATGATVGGCSVLGAAVDVGERAQVHRSVLLDGVTVGARTTVHEAIIGPRVEIGADCEIQGDVVIGEGATIEPGNIVGSGTRIFPGVRVSDVAIKS